MPSIHPASPDPVSPLQRLSLTAETVRGGSTTNTYGPQACNCFADDATASGEYTPGSICFVDQVEASSMYSGSSVCFADDL